LPTLDDSRDDSRRVASDPFTWSNWQHKRAVTAEIVQTMSGLHRVIRVSVEQVPIVAGDAAAIRRRAGHTRSSTPRMRELRRDAVGRPDRDLCLQRMILGTIGVVAIVDRAELWVGHNEILGEQSART